MPTYTIRLEDQASAAAARVQVALGGVASAAERVAVAVQTEDRAYQAVARTAAKYAGAELRAARATEAVLRAQQKNAKNLTQNLDPIRQTGKSWFDTAKSIGLGAIAFAYVAKHAIEAGRSLVEAAGSAQTWERNFTRITGDAAEIKETRDLIKSLGIGLEEGEHAMLGLRTQFDKQNAQAFLKIYKALSLTNEEASRFSLVLGQISGAGKLKGQDLNQVLQLPGFTRGGIAEQVAKEMNIDLQKATDMLGKGQVPADVAIRAIVHSGLQSHGLGPDANAPKTPEGALTGVDRGIAEASTGIDTQLSKVDNRVTELKRNLGEKLVAAGFIDDLNRLVDVLEKVVNASEKVYASLHKLGLGGTVVEAVTGKVEDAGPKETKQTGFEKTVGEIGRQLFMSEAERSDLAKRQGEYMAVALDQGMANGLTSAGQAAAAATEMAAGVADSGKTELGVHSPSTVFAELGQFVDEGLAVGIEDYQDTAFGAAGALADGAVSEADMALQTGLGVNQTAMANVGAAAGNAISSNTGGDSASRSVGPVSVEIHVDGSKDAATTVEAIKAWFDTDFAALLERQLEGSGA